ncbi:MAG: alpha/beta fold hydrolase [Caldilineae bacterium]|nr:MAG: alpha/beta fold hydrolase [Caldilineae bacterium]
MTDANLHFNPHPLARNPHFQTIIGSRVRPVRPALEAAAREMILHVPVGEGVRLQGFYSPQPDGGGRGLALMLHGWLGSANSTYIVAIGEYLFRRGYAIFRLNLRDHGDTVALNEGMFHGCLLEEVFQAARQAAALEAERPFFILGFSMGGNFALRLAWLHAERPIPNLRHVVAVSPSINPITTLAALDNSSPLYRYYFLHHWRRKLREKQAAFPHRYDFTDVLAMNRSWDIGEVIIPRYTEFTNSADYYACYAVTPEKMAALTVPTTIITARDDPMIPVDDFAALEGVNPHLRLAIQPYGGHVGFVDLFPFRRWLNGAIAALLEDV